jgi:hypothetical protein
MALDGIGVAVIPPDILVNVPASARLRRLKTAAALPDLHFVVSWPATPTSFAAQKAAEIATLVAQPATTSTRRH